MPSASEKKDREREFAKSALMLLRIPALVEDSESPDFKFQLAGEIVGLEVMEYARDHGVYGSIHRRQEGDWNRVMKQAQAAFSRFHSETLRVSATWVDSSVPYSSEIPHLANQLAQLISSHVPLPQSQRKMIDFHELRKHSLERHIVSVFVQTLSTAESPMRVIATGGPNDLLPDELQRLVTYKNEKVNEYRQKCTSVWLLIAAYGNSYATGFSTYSDVLDQSYDSAFDRAFLYDDFSRTICEVRLR